MNWIFCLIQKWLFGEKVTSYRIIDTLDSVSPRALQFLHKDGTWRFIQEPNSFVLENTELSQDTASHRFNGNGFFSIDSLFGDDFELEWFAIRWPDIEKYYEYMRRRQKHEQKKNLERAMKANDNTRYL